MTRKPTGQYLVHAVAARRRSRKNSPPALPDQAAKEDAFVIGIDFGTNSARAVVARCADGIEIGSSVVGYASGQAGILYDPADPLVARQHPGDYIAALRRGLRQALTEAGRQAGFKRQQVVGIGLDATGSSPLPVNAQNSALAARPQWRNHLAAQCWLWKDHSAWREAAKITALARQRRPQYLTRCGGTYSSEWFWAKILHCRRVAPEVFRAAHSWVELGDWVGSVLAGVKDPAAIVRGASLAGLKALYAEEWGGLPDKGFLAALDPGLADLRPRLYRTAHDASVPAGRLSAEWALALGLAPGLPIANAGLDCHAGAIGCGIKSDTLVKVIGTSSCDCVVLPPRRKIPRLEGVCGLAPGAILPGQLGVEAGQPAVGDIFRWWSERICAGTKTHEQLTREAARLAPGQSGLIALDWHNGNRSILADPRLSGLLVGCTLHTSSAEIYRALIESTAFGARVILENLRRQGVGIRHIVCTGGIAEKNPLLMQIYADVLGCTLRVGASGQACALGSAIAAAVTAGMFNDFPSAQRAMSRLRRRSYQPRPRARRVYNLLFRVYRKLHDRFGPDKNNAAGTGIMQELRAIGETASRRESRP